MTRISQSQLVVLSSQLTPRRQQLIHAVSRFRLASGDQLRRLIYCNHPDDPKSRDNHARAARSDLATLSSLSCLYRLDRRVGGVRAGSAGYVYALGAVGRRLIDLWSGNGASGDAGRSRYEPSIGFQDHALAVTECVVATRQAAQARGGHHALTYRIEREAWREFHGPGGQRQLKPDAELILQDGQFSDHWWLEVDRGTERRSVLQRKLSTYVGYYRTGAEQQARGVFPLIAWLTVTEARASVLRDEISRLAPPDRAMFRVALLDQAPDLLLPTEGASS